MTVFLASLSVKNRSSTVHVKGMPIGPFVTPLSGQWDADANDKRARDVTLRSDVASLDDFLLLRKPLSIERLPSARVIRIFFV